ncbi:MAG: hypothetical protein P8179_14485 [Candidatus Thiodiazotropha sp.]|jgi:hypothetical protein
MINRPLNIADHATLMMDNEIRRSGLAGNFCAIVYELDGSPDVAFLEQRAERFVEHFPEIDVRLRQQGRRYHWVANPEKGNLFFHQTTDSRENALLAVEEILNRSEECEAAVPVTFHLIESPKGIFFLIRWFHPICDAKGAELIIHHFLNDEEVQQGEDAFAQLTSKWSIWKKLGMMLHAKRHIKRLDRLSSTLPAICETGQGRLKFHTISFDAEKTKAIITRSMKEVGMTGTSLYFIGCLMRAIDQAGSLEKEGFCVPFAMNIRKRKALFPLVGNQVTFLFAQASMEQVRDRSALFKTLREQYKQTVRDGLEYAMIPLMEAGSWLSLEKFGDIIRNAPKGGERSSFWFSYTGEPDPKVVSVAGARVLAMFQLSQVTAPPSLAMLVNQYNGILTFSFSYIAGQIDQQWLNLLIEKLSVELNGQD